MCVAFLDLGTTVSAPFCRAQRSIACMHGADDEGDGMATIIHRLPLNSTIAEAGSTRFLYTPSSSLLFLCISIMKATTGCTGSYYRHVTQACHSTHLTRRNLMIARDSNDGAAIDIIRTRVCALWSIAVKKSNDTRIVVDISQHLETGKVGAYQNWIKTVHLKNSSQINSIFEMRYLFGIFLAYSGTCPSLNWDLGVQAC